MDRNEVLDAIRNTGIVPAVRVETEKQALDALEALCEGGILLAELALSTPRASAYLRAAITRFEPTMIIGAGSVLDAETARISILEGAQFIVSPMLSRSTIRMCRRYSIPILPGALTPTEILTAWTAGADIVKVFPANAAGGPAYIRAIRAPMPQVALMPMGGVTLGNATDFLKAGSVALGVGSDLVNLSTLCEGNLGKIAATARLYRELILQARCVLQAPMNGGEH
ncbi:MAG TPA: bifunctional 4-hydroxy-2-oxoglutarate aldolase/2-dehydro-3-deoxy-phosphogluconate aldolase [Alloacidobacterium sp.]|nr:bifunctional 4-hydroxy-2-oxoglutarate aldolase/2-dehydro-3-deoxy-phosphogluconate aldolase [Alloacidobacterium sp.]